MLIYTNQVPRYSSHRTRRAEVTWSDRTRLEAQLECPRPLEDLEEVNRLLIKPLPGMTSVTAPPFTSVTAPPVTDVTTLGSSAAQLARVPPLTEDQVAGVPPLTEEQVAGMPPLLEDQAAAHSYSYSYSSGSPK